MSTSQDARWSWIGALIRRHPSAALPATSALSEPPESLDLDTAKAALEQVNKRLDAELTLKTSTETRALTLAGQCTTLLSALTAALLVEFYGQNQRPPLLAAGCTAGACLFAAIVFAYVSARPRKVNFLPGRLPDELWDDLIAPGMKGPEFMARLMISLQDAMIQNELNQERRGRALGYAIWMVKLVVPLAVAAAVVAVPITKWLRLEMADQPSQSAATRVTVPADIVDLPSGSGVPAPPSPKS